MYAPTANAYRTQTVATADPITLVSMLFDGALKSVRKARILHADGDRTACLDAAQRASLILGELMAALDLSQGEIPARLSGIYAYCIRRLCEAQFEDLPVTLDEVERHVARIGDAWKQSTVGMRHVPVAAASFGASA